MADYSATARPLLVIVSGKPGSGKSTLARRLGDHDALEIPVLSRDALKAGLEETIGKADAARLRGTIVPRSFDLFHQTIEIWLGAGVSLIAEHSFSRTMPFRSDPEWHRHADQSGQLAGRPATQAVDRQTGDGAVARGRER